MSLVKVSGVVGGICCHGGVERAANSIPRSALAYDMMPRCPRLPSCLVQSPFGACSLSLSTWAARRTVQMLDVRENKVAVNIQAEGQSPVKMHEHVSGEFERVRRGAERVRRARVSRDLRYESSLANGFH